jgi:hypothetical protein
LLLFVQVLAELKSYMVEEWRSASSSFLLNDTSLPLPTSEIVAELDDKVKLKYMLFVVMFDKVKDSKLRNY